MRIPTLIALLAILVVSSQAQLPRKARGTSKPESAETVQGKSDAKKQQERAEDAAGTGLTDKHQVRSPPNQTTSSAKIQEDQTNRDIANFTLALVIVSALQFLALISQAAILKHHSILISQSIEQMRQAVTAYHGFVQASQDMLALTRESNEITAAVAELTRQSIEESRRSNAAHEELIRESNTLTRNSNAYTQQATELTRRSFILSHRPKLVVRNIVVRVQQGKQDIASVAQRLSADLADSVPGGELYVVNSGGTDANITAMHSQISDGERLPMAPPYEGKPGTIMNVTLPSGVHCLVPFPSEPYVRQHSMQRVEQGWEKFWVLGWIEYIDDAGNTRRTAFCRQWSNEHGRFFPVDDPDFENAD